MDLLLINSPITAQVLLPQYSIWEGFAFSKLFAFLQYAATHQLADYTTNPRYQKHYTMVQKNRVG